MSLSEGRLLDTTLDLLLTTTRPHSASALTQASFHAILVKAFLLGDISLNEWSKETHDFSSVLIRSGHELGRILLTDQLPMPVRIQKYLQKFQGTQAELNSKWKEFVGSSSMV